MTTIHVIDPQAIEADRKRREQIEASKQELIKLFTKSNIPAAKKPQSKAGKWFDALLTAKPSTFARFVITVSIACLLIGALLSQLALMALGGG